MKKIKLTQNKETIVDSDTYEWAKNYKWYAHDWGNGFYACRTGSVVLHRLIVNAPKGYHVDHINGNTLDNRKDNLRICQLKENIRNQKIREGGTSKYKGVCWHKVANQWIASIAYNKKRIHLGYFKNEIQAAKAYNEAAKKYHKEYARLNKIGEKGCITIHYTYLQQI